MRSLNASVIAVALLVGSAIGVAGQSEPEPRPAIPSAGCGSSDIEPGRHSGESGFPWQLFVPDTHDGVTPVPLVISLHAGGGSASDGYSQFAGVGEDEGVAVVAPDHDRFGSWMAWTEHDSIDPTPQNPDVIRIVAFLDDLGERLCLDLARVYATGLSGGGTGSYILGCALEDRIAAIGPVVSTAPGPDAPCPLDRPMPSIFVNGTSDPYVLWDGGLGDGFLDMPQPLTGEPYREAPIIKADALDTDLPVPERVAGAAVRNGCGREPVIKPMGSAERYAWECPDAAEVVLVAHGGGHEWGSVTDGRSTEELIWEFFEQHSLPE